MRNLFAPLALLLLAACGEGETVPADDPAPEAEQPETAPTEAPDKSEETAAMTLPDPRDGSVEDRMALLALSCVHKEYPNKISHVLQSDADARPPHELFPSFYGCFDCA